MKGELDDMLREINNELERKVEKFEKMVEKNVIIINEKNFDEIISRNRLVLVDCWASWCAPCILYEPVFSKVAQKYSNKGVVFARLNVDENPAIVQRFSIMNIPITLIIENGELRDTILGAVGEEVLEEYVKKYLKS